VLRPPVLITLFVVAALKEFQKRGWKCAHRRWVFRNCHARERFFGDFPNIWNLGRPAVWTSGSKNSKKWENPEISTRVFCVGVCWTNGVQRHKETHRLHRRDCAQAVLELL